MTAARVAFGFTLAELAVTIAVIGILSFAAIPTLTDRLFVDARGHSDQLRAMLQYAQKFAIAQRRNVCVSFAAGTATVQKGAAYGAACGSNIMDPVSGAATYTLPPPAGVTVTPSAAVIAFDALGGTAAPATVTITSAPQITVEGVTGYVH